MFLKKGHVKCIHMLAYHFGMTDSAPVIANYGTNSGPAAAEVWGEDRSVYAKLQNLYLWMGQRLH